MSRASAWAQRSAIAMGERPTFKAGLTMECKVGDDGKLWANGVYSPEQAVALARWILDTFGDPEDVMEPVILPDPTPLSAEALANWRRWHRPNGEGLCSMRGCGPDPWPCPVARLLATLEAGERERGHAVDRERAAITRAADLVHELKEAGDTAERLRQVEMERDVALDLAGAFQQERDDVRTERHAAITARDRLAREAAALRGALEQIRQHWPAIIPVEAPPEREHPRVLTVRDLRLVDAALAPAREAEAG